MYVCVGGKKKRLNVLKRMNEKLFLVNLEIFESICPLLSDIFIFQNHPFPFSFPFSLILM